jgi:hypothetical protein
VLVLISLIVNAASPAVQIHKKLKPIGQLLIMLGRNLHWAVTYNLGWFWKKMADHRFPSFQTSINKVSLSGRFDLTKSR